MAINWDGRGVFVAMHGGSRRIGPSNEAVTGRGDEKMDGVDSGKDGGGADTAVAALGVATLLLSLLQLLLFAIVCRMVKMVPGIWYQVFSLTPGI